MNTVVRGLMVTFLGLTPATLHADEPPPLAVPFMAEAYAPDLQGATITQLCLTADGKTVFAATKKGLIKLSLFEKTRTVYGPGKYCTAVAISSDGTVVAAFKYDLPRFLTSFDGKKTQHYVLNEYVNELHLWSKRPQVIRIGGWRQITDGIMSLAFSPDGKVLAGAGSRDGLLLWETATGKMLHQDTRVKAREVLFATDGRLAVNLFEGSAVMIKGSERTSSNANALAFSPRGEVLKVIFHRPSQAWSLYRDDKLLYDLGGDLGGPPVLTASSEAVAYAHQNIVTLVNRQGQKQAAIRTGDEWFQNGVVALIFGLEGKTLITGCQEGSVTVWETATGKCRSTLLP